ncbi:MAG TPA: tripartite tricarboxylate transporter TctB family protein [Hyphomicrobiaceae bacterium]
MAQRVKAALPYVVGLAIAAVLYHMAGTISYPARPGQLGPDFWPRLAIAIIAIVCIYEISRLIIVGSAHNSVQGIAEHLEAEELDEEPGRANASSRIYMLLGGLALTFAYAVLVPILGFLLASYIFLVVFMYLGGNRNHLAIWASSTIGILVFAFIFLKVVYVSLPRGVPPFEQVTQFIMDLFQIS